MDLHQMDEEGFIPSIHNYCDRWCERCRFIGQCRVGIAELDPVNGGFKERTLEESIEEMRRNFRNTLDLLRQLAAEQGIDPEELERPSPETEREERRQERAMDRAEKHPLSAMAMNYAVTCHKWLKVRREAMRNTMAGWAEQAALGVEPEAMLERAQRFALALETVERHTMLVASKTNRAIMGRDADRDLYDEAVGTWQTDFNGSAKLAMVLVEESLAGWAVMLELMPIFLDEALPLLAMLKKAMDGLQKGFPEAHRFIRPGFDAPKA